MVDVYSDLLIWGIVGKLVMFTENKLYHDIEWVNKLFSKLNKLFECGYCLGFWNYLAICSLVGINFFEYHLLVSLPLTAITFSFVVFLISAGWKTIFGVYSI